MYFQYGSYKHDVGEVELQRNVLPQRSPASGLIVAYQHQWSLKGRILINSGTGADLSQKVLKMISAYSVDGRNAGLVNDDGTVVPDAFLYSQNMLGGVIVTQPPAFPDGSGAAGVTYWDYLIRLEATYIPSNSFDIEEWTETLSTEGGMSTFVHMEPIWGWPVKVTGKQRTIYRATQTGRARGRTMRPNPAGPLFPFALVRAPRYAKSGPRLMNGAYVDYGIEWSYEYESITPLFGEPTTL